MFSQDLRFVEECDLAEFPLKKIERRRLMERVTLLKVALAPSLLRALSTRVLRFATPFPLLGQEKAENPPPGKRPRLNISASAADGTPP